MKILIVMRHAKTEPHRAFGDHERVLIERGERDSRAAGEWIASHGFIPDYIVASDAARTRQTAEIASQAAGYCGEIEFKASLYRAQVEELLDVIRALPDPCSRALLVGHNSAIEELVHNLASTALPFASVQTATIVAFQFNIDQWDEVAERKGLIIGCYRTLAKQIT